MYSLLFRQNCKVQPMMAFQSRSFARLGYHNKAQQNAIDMKSDLTCYGYKSELISSVQPGPRYPKKALDDVNAGRRRNAKYNLELIRTSALTKKANEQKFTTGRTHAHYNLHQLKLDVKKIRDTEEIQ